MMIRDTAIVFFVYSRPRHTRLVLKALKENINTEQYDLIIFSDAPRAERDNKAVSEVRDLCKDIQGFKNVYLYCRDKNLGLSKSILNGLDDVFSKYQKAIILEDDLIPSKYFLEFMSSALLHYEDNHNICSVSGYLYPIENIMSEPFFLRGADCWGWATWRDRWIDFNRDPESLLSLLDASPDKELFDYNGAYPYRKMLIDRLNGRNDSWAILWHAYNWLEGKLILYPNHSLIDNIGNDNSGENSGLGSLFDVKLYQHRVAISPVLNVVESIEGRTSLELFFRKNRKELKKYWAIVRNNEQFTKYWRALKRILPVWVVLLVQRVVFKNSVSS